MRHLWMFAAALALLPGAALAQSATPPQDAPGILVEGRLLPRGDGKPIPLSSWRVAETEHVLVYSDGEEKRLKRLAHNLEKLHFLLSMLLDRVDMPDDTLKLRVTLIGDTADFNQLGLRKLRWQQGPYPRAFPTERYYDPREDGAVLATTATDQKVILQQAFGRPSSKNMSLRDDNEAIPPLGGAIDTYDLQSLRLGEVAFRMSAEGRTYATFAQHYLMTYFPAAYPRWYLEGFGEIFATMTAEDDGVIEYGRMPEGFRKVMEKYGPYSLEKLLDGSYLDANRPRLRWTPYHAWALVHLLFFSEEWREPQRRYLTAVARGAPPEEAARALGDLGKLQRQLGSYRGAKVPYERLAYPPDRAPAPLVRRLTRSEAAYLKGRLVLGARLEIPPPGGDPQARGKALAARDAWIAEQRETAARFPEDLEVQLLVAEIECRSGNDAACIAAADRVLAVAPRRPAALVWKGIALTQQALAGPAAQRAERLRAARALIVRANRGDPDAVVPLLAYYRSFEGGTPTEAALRGLMKASDAVPSAPATQLMLGEALAGRGDAPGARRALRPVAHGAYETPEKPKAREALAKIPNRTAQ